MNVRDARDIDELLADLDPWLRDLSRRPARRPQVRWWTIQHVEAGGAADRASRHRSRCSPGTSRKESSGNRERAARRLRTDRLAPAVQKVVPEFNQERGRWAAVTREDLANATKRAFDGRAIGLYRGNDDLIPIVTPATRRGESGRTSRRSTSCNYLDRPSRSPLRKSWTRSAPAGGPLIWRRDGGGRLRSSRTRS